MQTQGFLTIPIPRNLEKSIEFMTKEDLLHNLVEVNLVAYNSYIKGGNRTAFNAFLQMMADPVFYYQNRYVLPAIFANSVNQQTIMEIIDKFDFVFVNGTTKITQNMTQDEIKEIAQNKQNRLEVNKFRQKFIKSVEQVSISLHPNTQIEKQQYFIKSIATINKLLKQNQKIKNHSLISGFILEEIPGITLQIMHNNQSKTIDNINSKNSFYIRTKNRHPIVFDFNFARFIYKNDDQLPHQIISMEIIKYLNQKLNFISPIIKEYNINPQIIGAFYQFAQQSTTVSKIIEDYGSLEQYFNKFQTIENNNIGLSSKLRKKFSQSYAGFCFIQYILGLKDRHNKNIMLKNDGTIFHIDLAFIFESKPGGCFNIQNAPFKMPIKWIDVMQGQQSDYYHLFYSMLVKCFTKFYQHRNQFFYKIQILSSCQQIKCFNGFSLENYKARFDYNLNNVTQFVDKLIYQSKGSRLTSFYDGIQQKNGIKS